MLKPIRWALCAAVSVTLCACMPGSIEPRATTKNDMGGAAGTTEAAILEAAPCARDTRDIAQGMPSADRIYSWIEDLVSFGNRRTGQIGGMRAAAYMKCQFEAMGLQDVHFETATTMMWEATKSQLTVGGEPVDSSPTPFTLMMADGSAAELNTGADGKEVEIVDIGLGLAPQLQNVKGKIAMFDLKFLVPTAGLSPFMEFLWDPGLTIVDSELTMLIPNPFMTTYDKIIDQIISAGAVGFIGVLDSGYFDSNKYYNESYHKKLPIPGVWVSPKDGAKVRTMMDAGKSTANIAMDVRSGPTIGRAVVGVLPGKSAETILITSHHDSAWNGAVEDASGAASVIAQAQYFASQPAGSRERTLMFVTMDSHWTGYEVHGAFAQKYIIKAETPYEIVGGVTIEHIGKQGLTDSDGQLVIRDQPEYRGIFENLGPTLKLTMINGLIKHNLTRTALLDATPLCPTVGIPTDAFGCVAGVPVASLIAGPNYLYDEADTLDKVAKDQLVPVANFFAELVEAMDGTPKQLIGMPVVDSLPTAATLGL